MSKALSPSKKITCAVMLALHAGLRVGEVCALRVCDIDFMTGTIQISRSVQRMTLNGKSQLLVQRPKSDSSERIVPLHSELLLLLRKITANMQPDAHIMTGLLDRPMDPRACQYQFTGKCILVCFSMRKMRKGTRRLRKRLCRIPFELRVSNRKA